MSRSHPDRYLPWCIVACGFLLLCLGSCIFLAERGEKDTPLIQITIQK